MNIKCRPTDFNFPESGGQLQNLVIEGFVGQDCLRIVAKSISFYSQDNETRTLESVLYFEK